MGWLSRIIGNVAQSLGLSSGGSKSAVAAGESALEKAQREAVEAQAAADREAEKNRLIAANIQSNSLALSNANASNLDGITAKIVAGGAAEALDSATKKKRVATPSISSTLGINL